jgi:hypothetical protein
MKATRHVMLAQPLALSASLRIVASHGLTFVAMKLAGFPKAVEREERRSKARLVLI